MIRRAWRSGMVLALVGGSLVLGPAAPAAAHPLGNFTVNTAARIVVSPGAIRVEYAVDMAELPTFQELTSIDRDGDGEASEGERALWAAAVARVVASDLRLQVGGRPVRLAPRASTAALRPGQAGLAILRFDATFEASAPERGQVLFEDGSFPGRVGWHEVSAVGTDGAAVSGSSVPVASPSGGLSAYPKGLLSSPLDIREARFSFAPGEQLLPAVVPGSSGRPALEGGRLAAVIGTARLSPATVVLGLLIALALGAVHALAPGHGKTITAAYLVGTGARLRGAVGAGVAVAAMHTASVVAVGILALVAERLFPPELVYPWLGLLAGAVAVALGSALLVARLRGNRAGRSHWHDHPGSGTQRPGFRLLSRRGLAALAVSGGILPSPTAVLVLVGAVALHRVAFGLALLVAFGVGLALALAGVGLLATRARDALAHRLGGRLAPALPVLSAAAIVAMGLVLSARAVAGF